MKILYLHDNSLDSYMANLVQVIFMCDAFCSNGNYVSLITRKHSNFIGNPHEYIHEKFGIDAKYEISFFEGGLSIFGKLKGIGTICSNIMKVFSNEFNKSDYDIIFLRSPVFFPLLKKYFSDKKVKCRIVYEFHNYNIHPQSAVLNYIWKKLLFHLIKRGIISHFIVISEALKNYWIKMGINEKRIFVYHDGFSENQFKYEIPRTEARKDLNISQERKVITYTGSLYPDRGIELIISLAIDLQESFFYIVGGPKNQFEYYSKVIKNKNIKNILLTGRIPQKEVNKYLYASDVLLLIFTDNVPTINYCSPLKVFEYMASGRIIVGHSYPTIKEVLKDGLNCLLSEPNHYNKFLAKLKDAITNDYEFLGLNARAEAFKKYTWTKRADSIMQSILNNI